MKKSRRYAWVGLLVLALATGCASGIAVARRPLILSAPPAHSPNLPLSIGVVKLPKPLRFNRQYPEAFLLYFAEALEDGMLAACRMVARDAKLLDSEQGADADLILVPTNPFLDYGRSGYNVQVTISMDVRLIQKGVPGEKGMLVEATGEPGEARPTLEMELLGEKFGLMGGHISGNPLERALNHALFNFCIQFTEKVAKRAQTFLAPQ